MTMIESMVLSVSQLNTYVKSIIDSDLLLRNLFVVGEISNFTNHYRTGHYYLTLKDENAAIKAVMFKSSNMRLRFIPENGMKVIVRGRASLFERDGQFQFYIEDMQPDGIGSLNLAFEQLKEKLSNQGLFNDEFKKPIPSRCSRIGVVTSSTGAVIQDIINVVSRRYPIATIILNPVEVQGPNAAPQIIRAIKEFNDENNVDVIIVGRGGGSIEDLWAFNEEMVALAVFESVIPVISAVGHETDFTICDFVADLRAPTPSAAAELAVPDIRDDKRFLANVVDLISENLLERIENQKIKLDYLAEKLSFRSPVCTIDERLNTVNTIYSDIVNLMLNRLNDEESKVSRFCAKLDALSPLKVMARGYSIALSDSKIITSAREVESGDRLTVRFVDGEIECEVL